MKWLFLCLIFVMFTTLEILGSDTKRTFIDGHNSRRLRVAKGQVKGQPSASEMNIMRWDNELYLKASSWAAKHLNKHNPDKNVKSRRFKTGENLYWYSTTNRNFKLDPKKVLQAWFKEHQNYTYGPLQRGALGKAGHYTQMLWSDSIYVGCAISQTRKGKWKKFYVVCNYGPAGNMIGQKPYKKGGPCTKLKCGCLKNKRSCNCNKIYGN